MKLPTAKTKKGSSVLIEPGIIRFSLNENVEWDLNDARETHLANLKLSQGGKFCVYMNVARFFIPTKEAQKFISSKTCTDYRIASAFVVKNLGVKLFANLFMKFFKSKSPSRLFSDEEKALKWLRKKYKEGTQRKSN